ncbi:AraC family transcriptional regulator [Paenibacillus sp. N4]|uniref:AraC family transcriptional regulator n=1 Tax=Paenibacillus vietnamensis TaxID=2590547 RepID=UPI001CD068FF|nr:AraC family transcriptional regulator [Paenibacillus vietnamensis]MCA0757068.1 AraC family transcriptional regulator [Paenibacillus vietnamensis]
MTDAELDSFLRKYTVIETLLEACETLEEKKAVKQEYAELHSDTLDEAIFIPPGQDITFSAHTRFDPVDSHRHSFIELIYIYSGECHQTINNKKVSMKQGELCILDTNTYHSIENTGKDDIIINCLMRKSYFDWAFLSRLSGNDIFSSFLTHAIYENKQSNEYILIHSGENEKISRIMNTILCEFFDKQPCSDEIINSYMVILFAEMLRMYKGDVNERNYSALKNTQITDIIHYLQVNFKTVTLESLARHFNFNPNYLGKILKMITGSSFIDLVHQIRISQACLLLKNTDVSVQTVANEVGYENINFFYRIFKRKFNCSPAEYRKSLGDTARK